MQTIFQVMVKAIVAELSKEQALKVLSYTLQEELKPEDRNLVNETIERLSAEG